MLISVEWTSASFTAELLEPDGRVAATVRHAEGTNAVVGRAFEKRFHALVERDWLAEVDAVYFAGMVTARNGWIETGFVPVPADLIGLAEAAQAAKLQSGPMAYFLPGVSRDDLLPDVMRGEEIKALAVAASCPEAIVVLPGAHTKYVSVVDGRIAGFATYMGGEIAALLRRDSLLSRLIPSDPTIAMDGFERGLDTAWDEEVLPGSVLRRAFSARSLVLFDRMRPDEVAGFIEGLLVGSEIAEAENEWPLARSAVRVIGESEAAHRYILALERRGYRAESVVSRTGNLITALDRQCRALSPG
jgi:2-dehydro-3-deoxygalactonokinase